MSIKRLNPRILIVEDDAGTYKNLKDFFTDYGLSVVARKDGKIVDSFDKAVKLLEEYPADIALLDIDINGDKNGLELGRHIVDCYKIPVIFLTGQDTLKNRLIADEFAHLPLIEKLSKTTPNELLMKSINFTWTKILLATPPAQDMEIRAVEMKVDAENFDIAETVGDSYPVKTILDCSRIYFISSFSGARNSMLIHAPGSKAYRMRNNMDQLITLLGKDFMRISKFAAVNLKAVLQYNEKERTCMVKHYTLRVGKNYWDNFAAAMQQLQKTKGD